MLYSNYKMLNISVRAFPKDKLGFPEVQQPTLVGDYSVSPEGNFENSGSRIRYLNPQPPSTCPFPLNAIQESHAEEDNQCGLNSKYLDNMFLFLGSSPKRLRMLLNHDIMCTRDVLELLMCSPYDYRKNWTIAVSKYRNTIFMCQVQNEEMGILHFDYELPQKLLKAAWMKKLRQHCLEPMTDSAGQDECEENGQYYGVFSMAILGIRLLFDAPVIGERSTNPMQKTFVDLQMRLDTMNRSEWSVYNRTEVLKWWVQCFLVGIAKTCLATYDKDGLVHRLTNTKIRDLWQDCKNDWSPSVCANFLGRFLTTIRTLLASVDCASLVYLFEFDAKNGIITYKVAEERNEHSFIPDWFRIMSDEHLEHLNAPLRFQ